MPIVGGKYVAPTWINKSVPAINASELNAISQTLAGLDNLQGKYYTVFGSYQGTGQEGSSHPTVISGLPGKPVAIIIGYAAEPQVYSNLYGNMLWVAPATYVPIYVSADSSASGVIYAPLTWGTSSVSFYATQTSASHPGIYQLNIASTTYVYMAIIEE